MRQNTHCVQQKMSHGACPDSISKTFSFAKFMLGLTSACSHIRSVNILNKNHVQNRNTQNVQRDNQPTCAVAPSCEIGWTMVTEFKRGTIFGDFCCVTVLACDRPLVIHTVSDFGCSYLHVFMQNQKRPCWRWVCVCVLIGMRGLPLWADRQTHAAKVGMRNLQHSDR